LLFQVFKPLLVASSGKFIVISSNMGQITEALAFPFNAYGVSKLAVNYLVKKMDMETQEVTCFPMQYVARPLLSAFCWALIWPALEQCTALCY
jgi:NAD(P)-dependent dehydrogenase (short-subunit alcohol dehydrogenase family)